MAEAFARFIGPAEMEYYSAGATASAEVDTRAIKAMREVGVDISQQRPKTMEEVPLAMVATVISLCSKEECPPLPEGVHHLSWPLSDPGATLGSDEDALAEFRRVRDQIRELVSRLF